MVVEKEDPGEMGVVVGSETPSGEDMYFRTGWGLIQHSVEY
jgi:hypothetical protein